MRPHFRWQLRSRTLELGRRTLIMGVVNITPDSFSDGGKFLQPERAVQHALQMLDEGADILDLGGESTRPGARVAGDEAAANSKPVVTEEEELRRVMPVLQGILQARPGTVISVDTYKSGVARAAVVAGAEIVNDVSGFQWDPADGADVRRIAMRSGADAHPRAAGGVAQSSPRAGHHRCGRA